MTRKVIAAADDGTSSVGRTYGLEVRNVRDVNVVQGLGDFVLEDAHGGIAHYELRRRPRRKRAL
jgi:hypothetical protein